MCTTSHAPSEALRQSVSFCRKVQYLAQPFAYVTSDMSHAECCHEVLTDVWCQTG